MRTDESGYLKMSEDPTRNRTRNHPSCGAVPQPTGPPLAPHFSKRHIFTGLFSRHTVTILKCQLDSYSRTPSFQAVELLFLTGKLCICRGSQISPKSRKRSAPQFHATYSQIHKMTGATVQNLVARVTWRPGFVQP